LLDYARLREGVSWTIRDAGDAREIVLDTPDRGRACDGLSFTVPAGSDYRIIRDGTPLQAERAELADAARSVIYVPWRRLDYGC
jgi:hypothetical protein